MLRSYLEKWRIFEEFEGRFDRCVTGKFVANVLSSIFQNYFINLLLHSDGVGTVARIFLLLVVVFLLDDIEEIKRELRV